MTIAYIAVLTTICGCILGIQIAFRPTMSHFDLFLGLCVGLVAIIIPSFFALSIAAQGFPSIQLVLNTILPTCLIYSGIIFGFGIAAGPLFVKTKRFTRYIFGFIVLMASTILAGLFALYM